ncbi:hypothetical protein [Psychroflexus sp. ALD_RP9]|uniref:hypothetical protein n=1 Tax=Psychroflexus sp. ALD_RP9 TaxID=2777186 RepID=UPI001A8DB42D|nr:hypothetical protein [Psychroflexus sp. ALD_RP9]QSS97914.1 hypothetical protein IMZ30_04160 [Psychroflexus sp. ALD_RP9]
MQSFTRHIILKVKQTILIICVLGAFQTLKAQQVKAQIDTAKMRIGEQINYKITVDGISNKDLVVFPKAQSFIPLELVEDLPIDTSTVDQNLLRLIKSYKLTQFDSGTYTIPPQLLKINNKPYLTDSLKVLVKTVVVDTTKQNLFPIKREINVEKPFQIPSWVWWLLAVSVILVLSYLIYFKFRKQKDESKRRLPPFEQAKLELEALEAKGYIESRKLKTFITELTNISRRYLEEKIEVSAMEYTTGELMQALYQKRDKKQVLFKDEYLESYNSILVDADLAKFAGHRPDVITLNSYKKQILKFIKHVQSAIPQPTDAEKKNDEAFQAKLKHKRRKQKLIFGSILAIVILAGATSFVIATKGFSYVRDSVFGNETKAMLQNDWITSEYSVPSIQITTPEVLIRQNPDSLGIKAPQNLESEIFASGSLYSKLYVVLSQVNFEGKKEFELDQALDGVYKNLESKGAYNILTKTEDFETLEGVEGIKVFGSFAIENPITQSDIKKNYQILNFGYAGNYQQLTIIYNEGDEYAETITKRIINSVEFEKPKLNAQ